MSRCVAISPHRTNLCRLLLSSTQWTTSPSVDSVPRRDDQQFRTLGLANGEFLQGTLSDLHIIQWKFVIIHMVAVDEEGQRFVPKAVWKAAVRRQQSRLEAHAGRTQLKLVRSGPATQSQLDSWSSQVHPPLGCELQRRWHTRSFRTMVQSPQCP